MALGFVVTDEMAAFIAQGNSMLVATRSAALEPAAVRACAIWATAPDRVSVLLPRATSARTVANLEDNGQIAVCVCSPFDFRAVQLKGHSLAIADATAEDVLRSEQQLRAFSDGVLPFGFTRMQSRNLWLFESWRVDVQVRWGFAQTPGPGAGHGL